MYNRLEIDLLHALPHKRLTVKFIEIHKTLKRATKLKRDQYMDIYIKAMMGNPLLKTIELSYNTEEYNKEHESIFDEIIMGLQGKAKRIVLDPGRIPKFKEIIVDIAGKWIVLLVNYFLLKNSTYCRSSNKQSRSISQYFKTDHNSFLGDVRPSGILH